MSLIFRLLPDRARLRYSAGTSITCDYLWMADRPMSIYALVIGLFVYGGWDCQEIMFSFIYDHQSNGVLVFVCIVIISVLAIAFTKIWNEYRGFRQDMWDRDRRI